MTPTDNSRVGPTPGPWRIRENSRHSPDECDLSICGDIWVLADINGPQYAHQEANARLIAAAPELLEALNYYADQLCEGWCEGSPDCAHFDDCGGCLARRVAFKATGAA